jgi:hypothetical protein
MHRMFDKSDVKRIGIIRFKDQLRLQWNTSENTKNKILCISTMKYETEVTQDGMRDNGLLFDGVC